MHKQKLKQFVDSIIAINAKNVDFTQTDITIITDYGEVTFCADNTIKFN